MCLFGNGFLGVTPYHRQVPVRQRFFHMVTPYPTGKCLFGNGFSLGVTPNGSARWGACASGRAKIGGS